MSEFQSRVAGVGLVAFGLLSLIFLALVAWAAVRAAHFQQRERPFILAFTSTLSRRWQLADVRGQLADAGSPEIAWQSDDSRAVKTGAPALDRARTLGALLNAQNVRLTHYVFGPHAASGEFAFTARFEHGRAAIHVRLIERGDTIRVLGFTLSGVQLAGGT